MRYILLGFSSQILHFMTREIDHHDRNGRFACYIIQAMISSFAKVVGLQSRQKNTPFFNRHELNEEHGSRQ